MPVSALQINDLGLSYGAHHVLDNVSLQVRAGEIFGLIGLNGQGKTSMIKAALDLCPPQSGQISIFGKNAKNPQARARIAYLPERFEPAWFLNGWEFLSFSLSMHGKKLDRDAALAGAQKLDLDEEALARRVQTYSKGMRQKLGILGSVLTDADLLILDEPMSGLDPASRSAVKNLMKDARAKRKAVFFSSHILSDMDEICGRVAVLHDRHINFTGTPAALKKQMGQKTLEQAALQLIDRSAAA